MKLTKKSEYALEALLDLADRYGEKSMSLRELAETNKISYKFLEQIMTVLKQAGYVRSSQGKLGGYTLARSPKKISLGELIRLFDGPLAPIGTAEDLKKKITQQEHPGLYWVLLEVRNAIADVLDKKTLADVLEKSTELAGASQKSPMYYI